MRVRNENYYPNGREPQELCSDEGALELARKIAVYWEEQGAPAPSFLFLHGTFTPGMRSARTDLRSNMKNGYPKGYGGVK